jgi:transposase-like protein
MLPNRYARRFPNAAITDDAEEDARLHDFPKEHRAKLHSTNPIERLNGEIKRRTEVVGIFPNDEAIVRLVGALLLEQNDEWTVQRARYITLETMASMSDDPQISCLQLHADIPSGACREPRPQPNATSLIGTPSPLA